MANSELGTLWVRKGCSIEDQFEEPRLADCFLQQTLRNRAGLWGSPGSSEDVVGQSWPAQEGAQLGLGAWREKQGQNGDKQRRNSLPNLWASPEMRGGQGREGQPSARSVSMSWSMEELMLWAARGH